MRVFVHHNMKRGLLYMLSVLAFFALCAPFPAQAGFTPDDAYLNDRAALEQLQREAFGYMWNEAHPVSGMAYETTHYWGGIRPVAVGGTGFGIAAIVVAVDRGWITREQAVARITTIVTFLRDKSPRKQLHGAFPHWLDGDTGAIIQFDKEDVGADIVETALLMQGLLIARAYFNGPGVEKHLCDMITELWEDVNWNWFTAGEEIGIHWHWSQGKNFPGLRILGYNEGLIVYILALASPTHPITRKSYDYWTSGKGYQPKDLYGYTVEASLDGGGPLFLAHYSFIGLDPRMMADDYVKGGYFTRNINQTMSNRSYCLYFAPAKNRYDANLWGLTASLVKDGYAVSEPTKDTGTVAPTAALSSMPYTPHYSMQVLEHLMGPLRSEMWGKYGPYDSFNLSGKWFRKDYVAIDQLPIVCMVENYRTGLLWRLFMADKEIQEGLKAASIIHPSLPEGFPEALVNVVRKGKGFVPDAHDIRRHPDTGVYHIPYWIAAEGEVAFQLSDDAGKEVCALHVHAWPGRNDLIFPQFMPPDGKILTLTMRAEEKEYVLPVRLH